MTQEKKTVIDVRSEIEYAAGHHPGSVNIPLNDIPHHVSRIKSMAQPIILCCASGMRSGQAARFLEQEGVKCHNAGSWTDVNFHTVK